MFLKSENPGPGGQMFDSQAFRAEVDRHLPIELPASAEAWRAQEVLFALWLLVGDHLLQATHALRLLPQVVPPFAKDGSIQLAKSADNRALRHLFAGAFLGSISGVEKALKQLAKREPAYKAGHSEFNDSFPGITDLRDSTQHIDERVQQQARGRLIEPKLLGNPFVSGPGAPAAYVLNSWVGDRFHSTSAEGRLVSLEISGASLEVAVRIVLKTLRATPLQNG